MLGWRGGIKRMRGWGIWVGLQGGLLANLKGKVDAMEEVSNFVLSSSIS